MQAQSLPAEEPAALTGVSMVRRLPVRPASPAGKSDGSRLQPAFGAAPMECDEFFTRPETSDRGRLRLIDYNPQRRRIPAIRQIVLRWTVRYCNDYCHVCPQLQVITCFRWSWFFLHGAIRAILIVLERNKASFFDISWR